MTFRTSPFLCLASLLVPLSLPLAGCVARGTARITSVIAVPLGEGATLVPHLAPDGRQGLVVEGRQPQARSPLIMAMLPRAEGRRGWDVVQMDPADGDGPTLGGRGRSVVLARAKVGGMPATLLFVAEPDPADPAPAGEARRMLIRTLRLRVDENAARFEAIDSVITRTRYCSGDDAVSVTFRLALADDAGAGDLCASPSS